MNLFSLCLFKAKMEFPSHNFYKEIELKGCFPVHSFFFNMNISFLKDKHQKKKKNIYEKITKIKEIDTEDWKGNKRENQINISSSFYKYHYL